MGVWGNVKKAAKKVKKNPKTYAALAFAGGVGGQGAWGLDALTGGKVDDAVRSGVDKLKGLSAGGETNVDSASTLTPEQEAVLSQNASYLNGTQNADGTYNHDGALNTLYSQLGSQAAAPGKSNYEEVAWNPSAYNDKSSYDSVSNWEGEFDNGVVNPAMRQMQGLIDNTKHSSNLHSSANRYAQDQVRNNTLDNLSTKRYDNVMQQQQMKMQGQEQLLGRQQNQQQYNEGLRFNNMQTQQAGKYQGLQDAQARQQAALTGLSNLNATTLGVNGVENIVSQQPGALDYLNAATNVATAGASIYGAGGKGGAPKPNYNVANNKGGASKYNNYNLGTLRA